MRTIKAVASFMESVGGNLTEAVARRQASPPPEDETAAAPEDEPAAQDDVPTDEAPPEGAPPEEVPPKDAPAVDPNTARYQKLLAAGKRHSIMAELLAQHAEATRNLQVARQSPDPNALQQALSDYLLAREAVINMAAQLDERPGDLMTRHPKETDYDFAHRLADVHGHAGWKAFSHPETGAFQGGSIDFSADAFEDPDEHLRHAHAVARAWYRSVPGGEAQVKPKTAIDPQTGQPVVVGSSVRLKTAQQAPAG